MKGSSGLDRRRGERSLPTVERPNLRRLLMVGSRVTAELGTLWSVFVFDNKYAVGDPAGTYLNKKLFPKRRATLAG